MGKIYCQGKRTTEKQAVCLELGPLCSISEFPLPTQPPPSAGVIRGAYTGAVQSYLTFSIKLLTFSGLTCAITYILAKRSSEMQNLFEFARTTENLNTWGALKLCRFSSPAMLCASSPHPETCCGPLRGWREGTDDISDYDLALVSKNTCKEFLVVFQNERDENKRLQWNLDLTKGQGTKKISEPPNDGSLLNSWKTFFNGVPRVLLDI